MNRILFRCLYAGCLIGFFFGPDSCSSLSVMGQVPGLIHYQGRIVADGAPYHGEGWFKLVLGGAEETSVYWGNSTDGDLDGEPDNGVPLPVVRGLFSVSLGDTDLTGMQALSPSVFQQSEVFLRVWFSDGDGPFERLLPDQRLAASAYAMVSAGVAPGVIQLESLAPGLLSTTNIIDTLSVDQLPAEVALKDPDLTELAAQLTAAWQVQLAQVTQQILSLSNQVQILTEQIADGGEGSGASGGALAISRDPVDAGLLSAGYVRFFSVPARSWELVSTLNAPLPRVGHSAVWANNQLFTWGGRVGAGATYSSSGHRYDPVADTWTELSPIDVPVARMDHVAVGNPDGMIVWGGFGAGGFLQSGGRYLSGLGDWVATSLTDAPEARDGHVGVWTGSRFLVWGGRNGSGLMGDGASYDPGTDEWTPLPTEGAPSARMGARGAWAGDRWLIWGGEGESGLLADGAQLLVDAFGVPTEWVGMNSTGAPSARSEHAVVWTGEEFLVWGGRAGGSFLGDGGAYDLESNSWSSMPPPGTALDPAGRAGHLMTWTGSELLIFGGQTATGVVSTGAALELSSGFWRPLPVSGDPVARTRSAGVWTGTEWVIFGGEAAGVLVGAPRRLSPEPAWHFFRKP